MKNAVRSCSQLLVVCSLIWILPMRAAWAATELAPAAKRSIAPLTAIIIPRGFRVFQKAYECELLAALHPEEEVVEAAGQQNQ